MLLLTFFRCKRAVSSSFSSGAQKLPLRSVPNAVCSSTSSVRQWNQRTYHLMLKCYGWALVCTEIYLLTCLSVLFRCTFVSRIFVVCHCSLSCIVYVHSWFCFYLSFYFPPWSCVREEWRVLRTVFFLFLATRLSPFFFSCNTTISANGVFFVFFCTQGRISVRLLVTCTRNKMHCWNFDEHFFLPVSQLSHLEMLWSMWIAFVPLLNCTIFRSYIFFSCATSHDGVVV